MDIIKRDYMREYQTEYQREYYRNNREDIAEKNRIYYEIHKKEKIIKEKVVIKKVVIKKVVIMNFDLIKVEKRLVTLYF